MIIEAEAITHTGNLRYSNEDSLLIDSLILNGISTEKPIIRKVKPPAVIGIADGMGGHRAGHIASEIALFSVKECFKNGIKEPETLIEKAKESLEENIKSFPERYGMGTTLSIMLFESENRAEIAHVGDTRIYRISGGIELLTEDNTEAWELYKKGLIGYEDIKNYPTRNILTSAVIADNYNSKPKIFKRRIEIKSEDLFLLCSDGFWEYFKDEEIYRYVKEEYSQYLLKECLSRGGHDNISFIICKVRYD